MKSDQDSTRGSGTLTPTLRAECVGSVLSYEHLSYSVPSASNGGSKLLIDDISLDVRAGELLAIMGPSGAGKSTLLDLMAFRKEALPGGKATLNGKPLDARSVAKVSCFVEQEDALLGVLTVRESITYALRLHLPLMPRKQVNERVQRVIIALGLQSCAEQKIGTPISRGISGGQKRRVTAACAMVTFPRILFLDEVTSGLDSTAAREVISSIRTLALAEGMIVVASIHQPSLDTLSQFTTVVFLAEGKLCYSGGVNELDAFFDAWKRPVGRFINPADHAMNFLNTDFNASDGEKARSTAVEGFREFFLSYRTRRNGQQSSKAPGTLVATSSSDVLGETPEVVTKGKAGPVATLGLHTLILAERSVKNYMRNLLAYGVRAGMYGGMGFMLATIWIRLGHKDSIINDRLSVHFYSVAFLAFMSVAGIPEYLEERSVYYRESKNGLYSTLPFVLANTLVTIPFLFLSESQVVVVASLLPIFVAALAITAFLNGFWMSVGGYFFPLHGLPEYAFELLTNSDLRGPAPVSYPSSTPSTCTVSGDDVLNYLDIDNISYGKWAALSFGISIIYRIALYGALKLRSK
ncbi:P-loop containing nucleoside triphosphate hydrolase protein [Ephemerocybe angulata]|uniref:P-loop containing nucleoside triphosphate hydrolase protein n=1 Tax=Ephemerocybe angulata TaxID=980116 RepID=A0A8H6HS33_9AGAR|nr:P-loop containing nucleoside triphosphate hydrolase protein [Tulosesus angulatus]